MKHPNKRKDMAVAKKKGKKKRAEWLAKNKGKFGVTKVGDGLENVYVVQFGVTGEEMQARIAEETCYHMDCDPGLPAVDVVVQDAGSSAFCQEHLDRVIEAHRASGATVVEPETRYYCDGCLTEDVPLTLVRGGTLHYCLSCLAGYAENLEQAATEAAEALEHQLPKRGQRIPLTSR